MKQTLAALLLSSVCASATGHAQRTDAGECIGVRDVGVFSDLDTALRVPAPAVAQARAVVDRARGNLVLYDGTWPAAIYPLGGGSVLSVGSQQLSLRAADRAQLAPLLRADNVFVLDGKVQLPPGDLDDDGIPDPLDVSFGAQKTALNADRYDGRYLEIPYPNGDVDRSLGVCTDVIIRALRNAGLDLQREVHEDIARTPKRYPMIKRANPSIDHRRVKSLLPYCQQHFEAHSVRLDDPADPLRPGDVLFMDTFTSRPGAEHVGIVSDRKAKNGLPLVINNWTDGTRTALMELLSWVPVTHRFRMRSQEQGPISFWTRQLVAVTTQGWDADHGELTRYQRAPGGQWHPVGAAIPVVLGHAGSAWGDGVHGSGAPKGLPGPRKREGDGRSPAGVFALGTLHGSAARTDSSLHYQPIDDTQVCVDDPGSRSYNLTVSSSAVRADFRSSERMTRSDGMYELALEVLHNRAPISPGHGSCIFVHVAPANAQLTGCIGLTRADMIELARWLSPETLLVNLPRNAYRSLRTDWALP